MKLAILNTSKNEIKGRSKPVQHLIQHHVFAILYEMLGWFAQLQNL